MEEHLTFSLFTLKQNFRWWLLQIESLRLSFTDGTRSLIYQLKILLINKLQSFPTQSQRCNESRRVATLTGTIFAAFGIFKLSFKLIYMLCWKSSDRSTGCSSTIYLQLFIPLQQWFANWCTSWWFGRRVLTDTWLLHLVVQVNRTWIK